MEKSLLEKMEESKIEFEYGYVTVNDNGTISKERNYIKDSIERANNESAFDPIERTLTELAAIYSRYGTYDTLKLNLCFGIVYPLDALDTDGKIKADSKPINNLVHVYTMDSNSSLDGAKVMERSEDVWCSSQTYIDFDVLMNSIEKEGLIYNGPESFDELRYAIKFDGQVNASLTAEFSNKKNKTLVRK